jgi:hypothetical protein
VIQNKIAQAEFDCLMLIPRLIGENEKRLLASLSKAQQAAYHEARKLRNRALELAS